MDERLRREVALFRYGVIADLVHDVPDGPRLYARIREKARQDYRIPGTLRTRVAVETMRGESPHRCGRSSPGGRLPWRSPWPAAD